MGYFKEISATVTIYPDFYKCVYFDYLKKKINDWIGECLNTYSQSFTIKVSNPSGIAQFYSYAIGDGEIEYDKIWKNSHGRYVIHMEACGEVMNGLSDTVLPPKDLMEHSISYVNFKYMESSRKDGIKIMAFGKENSVPSEYSSFVQDVEGWRRGVQSDISCIARNFRLAFIVGREIYDSMFNLLQQLMEINEENNRSLHFEMDESVGLIGINGEFLLPEEQKGHFFDVLKEIGMILIQDDLFEIEEANMAFTPLDKNIFYMETYSFNDIIGVFQKKSLLV